MLVRRLFFCFLAVLLTAGSVLAAPPPGYDWVETLREDCKGTSLDPSVWKLSNDTWNKILSVRDPRNVVLKGDGICRLLYKSTPLQDKPWSSGGMVSEGFQQVYGYFEVHMKYAAATGAHQSFWIIKQSPNDAASRFEIDINEGEYPGKVSANLHQALPQGIPVAPAKSLNMGVDLSADYHSYGLLWLPDPKSGAKLTWFMDGKPFHSLECARCTSPAPLLLTGAVVSWARPTPALDGMETHIKNLRVYQLRDIVLHGVGAYQKPSRLLKNAEAVIARSGATWQSR